MYMKGVRDRQGEIKDSAHMTNKRIKAVAIGGRH